MELLDFDAYFSDFLDAWAQKHPERFKRPEDLEEEVPHIYEHFLATPADWLDGATPGTYYDRYDEPQALIDLMLAYIAGDDISVPDPLLERLATLGNTGALLTLAKNKEVPEEARMIAIDILRQLESTAPMVDYIRWQVDRDQGEDILDNALESLQSMGEAARGPAKIAFTAAGPDGKEALLEVLCQYPGDEDVFQFALSAFQTHKDKRGLYAGYLAKLDDDRALEALLDVAEGEDVSYVDFIEIRSAIERLGSEAPIRDFASDPTYQAVQRLQ